MHAIVPVNYNSEPYRLSQGDIKRSRSTRTQSEILFSSQLLSISLSTIPNTHDKDPFSLPTPVTSPVNLNRK